jgi:4-amino-4-deoxy-L-arabinose transferase-like glycosyltransferase
MRFVERPALMSWLIAALGSVFGINQWTVRLPHVVSLLVGGILVFRLARTQVSALAAAFAASCFFLSPIILQKRTTAEPDVMLSVTLFGAFMVWWEGHARGGPTLWRWLATGLLLATGTLIKGPQPAAYFLLGVGAFLVLRRHWDELPGFILANAIAAAVALGWYAAIYQPHDLSIWAGHSRLTVDTTVLKEIADVLKFTVTLTLQLLPAAILAVPFAVQTLYAEGRFRAAPPSAEDRPLALVLYAVCCTAVLAVWPGGAATRYAMPAALAVAVLGGLAFERFRQVRPALVRAALCVAACLLGYGVVVNWLVMPLWLDAFQRSRIAARAINAAVEAEPAPISGEPVTFNNNVMAYIPSAIRMIPADKLSTLEGPAWAFLSLDQVERLRALRPDLKIGLRAVVHEDKVSHLVRIEAR